MAIARIVLDITSDLLGKPSQSITLSTSQNTEFLSHSRLNTLHLALESQNQAPTKDLSWNLLMPERQYDNHRHCSHLGPTDRINDP